MIVERRVAAMGIVPAFDKVEDCHARFDLSFEAAAVEQFAFERGKEALAHRVIEAIADRAHRGSHAGLAAALAEGERSVPGEFKRSSQHLDRENCDDYSKAPFRSMRASTVAITRPASGSTAGELSAVLGIDCGRPFNRGRCYRRRSVARRGWPVVPEGGRHATVTFFAVFEAPVGPLSIVCRARRDRHLACSRTGSLRDCPQAWAGPFDDLPRAAPERRDA